MGLVTSYGPLLILASLAEAPRHGYAIRKDIDARTAGTVRVGSTTLYRLLGQLLDQGLIEEVPSPAAADDPRRCYYSISRAGRRELTSEIRRLDRVRSAVTVASTGR